MITPFPGKLRKDEENGWAPTRADGDLTFDHAITDWEVVFTGGKCSWDVVAKYTNNCQTCI